MPRPSFSWRVLVTERTTALVPMWAAATAALTIVAPLTAGALTGHGAQGVQVALGAYFLAITAIDIYGARRAPRAAVLAVALVLNTAGYFIGACTAGHPWAIGALMAMSVLGFPCLDGVPLIKYLGLMPVWCAVLGAGLPATADPGTRTLLFVLGAVLFCTTQHRTTARRSPGPTPGGPPGPARDPPGGSPPWTPPSTTPGSAATNPSCPRGHRCHGPCHCGPAPCPRAWASAGRSSRTQRAAHC